MPHPMALQMHALTHPGHIREHNEDAHGLHPEVGLAVLADGMGGSLAGEVASGMAVSRAGADLAEELARHPSVQASALQEPDLLALEALMRSATASANTAIHTRAQAEDACRGMGTTLVLAIWRGSDLLVGHVGDSRAYRLHARAWRLPTGVRYRHEVQRLTRDHNLGQQNRVEGLPRPPQTADDTRLTRALGVESDVVLELHRHRLQPDDVVLLCTDGLSDVVADTRIEQIAHEVLGDGPPSVTPRELAHLGQALVDEALAAGGPDNITVVLGARPPESGRAA